MKFEIKNIDYSKLKEKTIAVIYENNFGFRFANLLDEIVEMNVEYYNVDFNMDFYIVNTIIKELNSDDDVVLVVIISDETAEILVRDDKRYHFISLDVDEEDLTSRLKINESVNMINLSGIVRRLECISGSL